VRSPAAPRRLVARTQDGGPAGAGAAAVAAGAAWHPWFPVNKNLWTSSFVLETAGLSMLLLGVSST